MKDSEWNQKLERANLIESIIADWYKENIDPTAHRLDKLNKYFDIVCLKVGGVEVKEDLIAHHSGNYAIEFMDASDKPSGIDITEAGEFVLVDKDHVVFSTTENLKHVVDACKEKKEVQMGYMTNEGKRARGWLVPRGAILYSPFVHVEDRWFPFYIEELREYCN